MVDSSQCTPGAQPVIPKAVAEQESARQEIALQAIYQTDAMLDMISREHGRESFDLVLEATLPRLKALMSVAMSVLGGDDFRTIEEMGKVVHGRH